MHSTLVITHTWKCAECGRGEASTYQVTVAETLAQRFDAPRPSPPANWTVAGGDTYCDAHDVAVSVRVKLRPEFRTPAFDISQYRSA